MLNILKLIIVSDSHIKWFPTEPYHLQQVIFKNVIVTAKVNFKDCRLQRCKVFVL